MLHLPPFTRPVRFKQISDGNFKNIFDCFPIHAVHLLIPNSDKPFSCNYEKELLSDRNTYFLVKDVAVTSLIQSTFLQDFVKTGLLMGISYNARIETENFLSIIPPGKLILCLEKEIHVSLGLFRETIIPKFKKRKSLFQTITIDMTNPRFSPGNEHYKHIFSKLSKLRIKFNLLLKWEPPGNICPQSMKSYFTGEGVECIAYKPKYKYSHKKSVPVPKISYDIPDPKILETFVEWIGMQICGIEYSTDEDDYACKLTVPEFSETLKSLCNHSFMGFYSKADVLSVIKVTNQLFDEKDSPPFIVLCLSGYEDAYVKANSPRNSEDKEIYLIIFSSDKYLVISDLL